MKRIGARVPLWRPAFHWLWGHFFCPDKWRRQVGKWTAMLDASGKDSVL
jgi:hypothetical protein